MTKCACWVWPSSVFFYYQPYVSFLCFPLLSLFFPLPYGPAALLQDLFTSDGSRVMRCVCVCLCVCVCVCASVQLPPSKTENTTVKMSFVGWVGGRGRNFLRHLPVPETPTKDQVCQMREIAGAHSPVVHSLLPPRFHTHTVLTLASTHTHSASAITAPRLAAGGGGGG